MTDKTSLRHDAGMIDQPREVDLAAAAALFGDPARAAMLTALCDGHALPAGDLARRAGVAPATATAHLRRLVQGGLVRVRVQGRHRYHELSGPHVASVLEALAHVAPEVPLRSLRQHRDATVMAEARTCYDHLAGRRGVELRDRLLATRALHSTDDQDHDLTAHGERLVAALEIDFDQLRSSRRIFARACLDWTQRRPHLAGALPAAITSTFLARGWLERGSGRGLRVAPHYDQQLDRWLTAAAGKAAFRGPHNSPPWPSR